MSFYSTSKEWSSLFLSTLQNRANQDAKYLPAGHHCLVDHAVKIKEGKHDQLYTHISTIDNISHPSYLVDAFVMSSDNKREYMEATFVVPTKQPVGQVEDFQAEWDNNTKVFLVKSKGKDTQKPTPAARTANPSTPFDSEDLPYWPLHEINVSQDPEPCEPFLEDSSQYKHLGYFATDRAFPLTYSPPTFDGEELKAILKPEKFCWADEMDEVAAITSKVDQSTSKVKSLSKVQPICINVKLTPMESPLMATMAFKKNARKHRRMVSGSSSGSERNSSPKTPPTPLSTVEPEAPRLLEPLSENLEEVDVPVLESTSSEPFPTCEEEEVPICEEEEVPICDEAIPAILISYEVNEEGLAQDSDPVVNTSSTKEAAELDVDDIDLDAVLGECSNWADEVGESSQDPQADQGVQPTKGTPVVQPVQPNQTAAVPQSPVRGSQGRLVHPENYRLTVTMSQWNKKTDEEQDAWNRYASDIEYEGQAAWLAMDQTIHHFNWLGNGVHLPTSTSPEVSLFVILTEAKYSFARKQRDNEIFRNAVVTWNAMQQVDPVLFDGNIEHVFHLRGTSLRDALTGSVTKLYTSWGTWVSDTYDLDDDVPLHDILNVDTYLGAPVLPFNGWYRIPGVETGQDYRDEANQEFQNLFVTGAQERIDWKKRHPLARSSLCNEVTPDSVRMTEVADSSLATAKMTQDRVRSPRPDVELSPSAAGQSRSRSRSGFAELTDHAASSTMLSEYRRATDYFHRERSGSQTSVLRRTKSWSSYFDSVASDKDDGEDEDDDRLTYADYDSSSEDGNFDDGAGDYGDDAASENGIEALVDELDMNTQEVSILSDEELLQREAESERLLKFLDPSHHHNRCDIRQGLPSGCSCRILEAENSQLPWDGVLEPVRVSLTAGSTADADEERANFPLSETASAHLDDPQDVGEVEDLLFDLDLEAEKVASLPPNPANAFLARFMEKAPELSPRRSSYAPSLDSIEDYLDEIDEGPEDVSQSPVSPSPSPSEVPFSARKRGRQLYLEDIVEEEEEQEAGDADEQGPGSSAGHVLEAIAEEEEAAPEENLSASIQQRQVVEPVAEDSVQQREVSCETVIVKDLEHSVKDGKTAGEGHSRKVSWASVRSKFSKSSKTAEIENPRPVTSIKATEEILPQVVEEDRDDRSSYDGSVEFTDILDIPSPRLSFPQFFYGDFAIAVGHAALKLGDLRYWFYKDK